MKVLHAKLYGKNQYELKNCFISGRGENDSQESKRLNCGYKIKLSLIKNISILKYLAFKTGSEHENANLFH